MCYYYSRIYVLQDPYQLCITEVRIKRVYVEIFLPSFAAINVCIVSFDLILPEKYYLPVLLPLLLLYEDVVTFHL